MKIQLKDSNLKRAVKNVFLKRNNIIVVEPRYGLGDSIVCNGIVRELAKKNTQKIIYYACPNLKNYHSILWMLWSCPYKTGHSAFATSRINSLGDFSLNPLWG